MNTDDYAILIGIGRYPTLHNDGPADLHGPQNDVASIKEWLLDARGGALRPENVYEITSDPSTPGTPDEVALEKVVESLNDKAHANKNAGKGLRVGRRIYFYLSGHGFSPARQKGALFTANATKDSPHNIHATGWLAWLQDAGFFREFVFWMDACMNRAVFVPPRDLVMKPISAREPPRANFIAFAAQRPLKAVEMPIPQHGGIVHGLFTWTLLEGLRGAAADANGRVTGRSLADWLRNALSRRMSSAAVEDPDVAKEPEIVAEDSALIFTRGVAKPLFRVAITFENSAHGASARLWSGVPPRISETWLAGADEKVMQLTPGLYLIDADGPASLRQGFEVLGDMSVHVAEPGPLVDLAAMGKVFSLDVDPVDAGAEVFIIDGAFSLADGAPGKIAVELPFGLFKVKTRSARSSSSTVILLDHDRPGFGAKVLNQRISTVIPFIGSPSSHEYQSMARANAVQQSCGPQATRGATLMVMARTFGNRANLGSALDPWQSVRVLRADGEVVMDLETDGIRERAQEDPFAYCSREVEAGTYYLRQRLGDGTLIEQSLIVPPGWRLEAHVMRRIIVNLDEGSALASPRPRIAVTMAKAGAPPSDEAEERLLEIMRIALADERSVLGAELEAALRANFENPMMGILGGHLLLIERERDPSRDLGLLTTVVHRLRGLFGPAFRHPDVEALALKAPKVQAHREAISGPPMFNRSWQLLTEASYRWPELVPRELWERVRAQGSLPPFRVWATDEATYKAAKEHYWQTLKHVWVSLQQKGKKANAGDVLEQAFEANFGRNVESARQMVDGALNQISAAKAPSAHSQKSTRNWQEAKKKAISLGVPSSAIDFMKDRF